MQTSSIVNHIVSLGLLVLQIGLIAFTVWFFPTRLTTKWFGIVIFIFTVSLLWFAYAVLAMVIDGLLGNDVPGVGYLALGFVSGVIGFFVYGGRRD